eukprot:11156190-Lingulodinium_polyedra.AAC.1
MHCFTYSPPIGAAMRALQRVPDRAQDFCSEHTHGSKHGLCFFGIGRSPEVASTPTCATDAGAGVGVGNYETA